MTTWADLAKDNTLAAYETFDSHRWRTCISRAYFAIYSAATDTVLELGVSMPAGRTNPRHDRLANLVGHNLTGMAYAVRW